MRATKGQGEARVNDILRIRLDGAELWLNVRRFR